MHVAWTPWARMDAVVIVHFGLEMGLIVIITIHVGATLVQKILYQENDSLLIKMNHKLLLICESF